MPANLTPQYLAAEQRFKEATSVQEKIDCLEEMMATIPKHKGTEKMRADLKRRMAKLREESQKKGHASSRLSAMYSVHREGAGQIVLTGAPNTGKSSILARLTHAAPEIGDYPYTTRLPQPGMMPHQNVQVQIVDLPPIDERTYEPWIGGIVRAADLVLLVVDLGNADVLEEVEEVRRVLASSRLVLEGRDGTRSDGEETGLVKKPAVIGANKVDDPVAPENLPIVREFFGVEFEILPFSAATGSGMDALRESLYRSLNVVRVYTKIPGKKADLNSAPFVLKRGSTVLDLARAVHRDFSETLKFARIWSGEKTGSVPRYNGQMVDLQHPLDDEDIVELHN